MVQFRQGDVYVVAVKSIPKGMELVARENGRVVLAHGELTGHAHAIAKPNAALFRDPKLAAVFLQVTGGETHKVAKYRETDRIVGHDEDGDPIFETVLDGYRDVEGVALEHEEHSTIVIPPGNYQVIRQREYHPLEIRQVSD